VVTDQMVARVLFQGNRAIGVVASCGREYRANKEVILAGGAINTPQLLLLSGVGPDEELKRHEIKLVSKLQMVGRNLQDHCFSAVGIALKKGTTTEVASQSPSPMGWFKLPELNHTPESRGLPLPVQEHRLRETVPDFEIATVRV
jgi:choline dehydrogenase-like flavoprotein